MTTDQDQDCADDLRALAGVAIKGELCSLLFPHFVEGFQQHTGREPSYWTRAIARRIKEEYDAGGHRSPEEIATILRAKADELDP